MPQIKIIRNTPIIIRNPQAIISGNYKAIKSFGTPHITTLNKNYVIRPQASTTKTRNEYTTLQSNNYQTNTQRISTTLHPKPEATPIPSLHKVQGLTQSLVTHHNKPTHSVSQTSIQETWKVIINNACNATTNLISPITQHTLSKALLRSHHKPNVYATLHRCTHNISLRTTNPQSKALIQLVTNTTIQSRNIRTLLGIQTTTLKIKLTAKCHIHLIVYSRSNKLICQPLYRPNLSHNSQLVTTNLTHLPAIQYKHTPNTNQNYKQHNSDCSSKPTTSVINRQRSKYHTNAKPANTTPVTTSILCNSIKQMHETLVPQFQHIIKTLPKHPYSPYNPKNPTSYPFHITKRQQLNVSSASKQLTSQIAGHAYYIMQLTQITQTKLPDMQAPNTPKIHYKL
eukprot:gene3156-2138_t